jgi:hypothetical protein
MAHEVLKQRQYYTGTNSVETRSLVVTAMAHDVVCVPDTEIPGGTDQVQFEYGTTGPRPPMAVSIAAGGRQIASGQASGASTVGLALVTIPLTAPLPAKPANRLGSVCLTVDGAVQLGGMAGLRSNETSPTLNGKPFGSRVSIWFLPQPGRTRSLVDSWPDVMRRVALFRPGFASPLFYWLLFLLGMPLLAYSALRLLALAEVPGRRIALGIVLVALASGAAWALTTAAFDSPDESEHFAYTASIAETGRAPDPAPSARSPYASDEVFALDAVRHFSQIETAGGRPPWAPAEQQLWRARVASQRPRRDDGGGYAVATAPHSPLYYSLLIPGYELGHGGGVFSELFWMRFTSALMGALVALCAYGTLRELLPRRRLVAVTGALLVAFQPMFGFISGAVNNDNGANAAAAVLVYLIVRALRRGLTWRIAVAVGVTAALLPLMKGTGYALFPAAVLALLAIAARARAPRQLVTVATTLAAFGLTTLVWGTIASGFHRSAVTVPGGASGATGLTSTIGGRLTYFWEVFLPRLPFMHAHWAPGEWPFYKIYVQRGWGSFGWYTIFFPGWVYQLIVAVMVAAALAALTVAWRYRDRVLARWREAIFLMLVILGVLAAVEFYYYAPTPRPPGDLPEQGRYAFTAAVPLAGLAVAGLLGLRRRWALPLATAAVTAMVALSIGARLLYLTNTYT